MSRNSQLDIADYLLVVICAIAALALHKFSYAKPPGMVVPTTLSHSTYTSPTVYIESFTVTGLSGQVNFSDSSQGMHDINQLWERFYGSRHFNEAVDWSEPQTLFAVYNAFAGDRAMLTIGFDASHSSDSNSTTRTRVTPGNYIHYNTRPPQAESVTDVWNDFFTPNAASKIVSVIERYAVDTLGETRDIQIQVLLQ
ncbi:MAG: effector binding domain-containing protein [Pseudomonadota bacterium]